MVYTWAGSTSPGLVDGPLLESRFQAPYGLCYDPTDSVFYVADTYNHAIRRIEDGIVTTVAGNGDIGDEDGQGAAARFNHPTGVAFKSGWLYICDNLNNKIKRMDASGNVTTVAGSGDWGYQDGPSDQAAFKEPKGIAVDDDGNVFVADYENHRIRRISNGEVSTVAGNGIAGDGSGPALSCPLHRPRDLCLATDGTIYFSDLMNHRIKKVTPDGEVVVVAGSGQAGWADGTTESAQLNSPVGVDWLGPTELIVMDSMEPRFRKVGVTGVVTTLAGSGGTGYLDGPAYSAMFDLPQDVCRGANGDLYIVDRTNNCIRIMYKSGNEPRSIAESAERMAAPWPVPTHDRLTIALPSGIGPWNALLIVAADGSVVPGFGYPLMGNGPDRITLDLSGLQPGAFRAIARCTRGEVSYPFVKL